MSNEQIFLRHKKRVTKATWENWCSGIKANMNLPAIKRAWKEIKEKSPSRFDELRYLENKNFQGDPRKWNFGQNENVQK